MPSWAYGFTTLCMGILDPTSCSLSRLRLAARPSQHRAKILSPMFSKRDTAFHTRPKKIEVIQKAPVPLNVTELRSFLGIVNYYGKFIQSVADLCALLNELLQKNTPWMWTATCMESFNQLKQALGSAEVLCHYNPSEEISLACDASAHGLGAVLSHHFKDGSERPISYAHQEHFRRQNEIIRKLKRKLSAS